MQQEFKKYFVVYYDVILFVCIVEKEQDYGVFKQQVHLLYNERTVVGGGEWNGDDTVKK